MGTPVAVRLLNGREVRVTCAPTDALSDLKQALQNEGLRRCRLNLRGAFLNDDSVCVHDLGLQPGEFLVAFETRKKKKQRAGGEQAAVAGRPAVLRPPAEAACATPPESPRQQWAHHGDGTRRPPLPLASPGQVDSLLPGYLSRPNPSPLKARLLPAPSDVSGIPMEPAAAADAASTAASHHQWKAPAAKRARSLFGLAAERFGGDGGGQAASPPAQQLPQQQALLGSGGQPGTGGGARPAVPQHLFADLQAELQDAALVQQANAGAGAEVGPSVSDPGPPAQRRAANRGTGSKRKQSGSLPRAAEQQEAAASGLVGGASGATHEAAGSSLLALSDADLDAASAVLPLPPLARQLEGAFAVLAQVHAFLTQQHIQATWGHVRQAAEGARLRRLLSLADCRLMAAVCPELVAVQQHHRVAPRSFTDSWRMAVSSPHKARAAVAAAAAAEAAAGDTEALPNPMHLRTDGAGTVLGRDVAGAGRDGDGAAGAAQPQGAADDDTLVIDMSDPGRGFLARPIPPAFLQHLRQQMAATATPSTASDSPGGSGTGQLGDGASGAEGDAVGAPGGDACTSAAIQLPAKARQPAFRINKLVRQRWCFRRGVVRALLLLQRQWLAAAPAQTGQQGPAGQQAGQQPQLQGDDSDWRPPRRGAGAARAPCSSAHESAAMHWQPPFDPCTVTAEELGAAGEQLAAPIRAAAAAAEREVGAADALAAARRARRGQAPEAASGPGVAPGVQRAAAKPPQLLKHHAPCTDTTQMGSEQFLAHLQHLPWYEGQVVHVERMAARSSQHAAPATPLARAVAAALQLRGVRRMFTHQAAAIDHLLQGRHTVVATSTASGKSLCYLVPIMQALAQDRSACALLMFPTKALAQDQLRSVRELLAAAFGSGGEEGVPAVEVYDGDTPKEDRDDIRNRAQLLITNPDMLHQSVLPVHQQFGRILANLKYVVVDEGHALRGIFGCHAALVLRRLRRLCERIYNSQPTFAVTTATLANPSEHARELLGVSDVQVVDDDGSPHGPRTFVFWNPPLRQMALPEAPWRAQARHTRETRQAEQHRRQQEANQQRGSGLLDPRPSEAERLAAAKLAERQQQLHAALGGQQDGIQPQATAQGSAASAQRQQVAPRPAMTAALRRELAEAQAALAAVGGSSRLHVPVLGAGENRAAPVRPLIRRQPLGARAAVEQLAAAMAAGSSWRGRAAAGRSSPSDGDDADYRSRLPTSKDWKAASLAKQQASGEHSGRHGEEEGEEEEERRSSPIVELSLLLAECVQHGLRTIAFCKSRKLCELVTAYVREILRCTAPQLADSIAVYRAGYSPAERREIERALHGGGLRAVAATNALELGVDVGSLDATLHLGFPGSVASLRQQAGRAGRREQPCLGVYLGWDGPLDQFFMRHPEQLFGRPVERAMVDARNPAVLDAHLACAAAEAPLLLDDDCRFFGSDVPAAAAVLQSAGLLGRHPLAPSARALHYVGVAPNPASKISLRAIDPERFAVVDESLGGQLLEEVEESKAFFSIYDGAVFMHQGRTYLCKKLDLDARVAVVRPADVKYYTRCIDFTDVSVRGGRPAYAPALTAPIGAGGAPGRPGDLAPSAVCSHALVTTRWLGFRRIWRGTGQAFDTVDLFLPDVQFETEAAHCRLPAATRQRLKDAGLPFRDGVHAACHALLNVLPLLLMCGANDVGTECDSPLDSRFKPERLLLFDKHPGGIGLAAAAAPLFPQLVRRALQLVRECDCSGRSGCPACVQHTDCTEYNAVLHKRAAVVVLESLLEEGVEPGGAEEARAADTREAAAASGVDC